MPHIEKPCPTRTPQIFAPGHREHIAAYLLHVYGHLPDALAGIQQIEHTCLTRYLAYLRSRLDQSIVIGNMGEGDELHARVYRLPQGFDRDLAVGIVWNGLD